MAGELYEWYRYDIEEVVSNPDLIDLILSYINFTICSTNSAFALVVDRSVRTWGDADFGGDSSRVQAELKQGVDTVYSTFGAFAAKMQDGRVVTWGRADRGGDSSRIQAACMRAC
jgi:hypothetical protein